MRTDQFVGDLGPKLTRCAPRIAFAVFALLFVLASVMPTFAQYKSTVLVSNQPGVAANTDTTHLLNAWGFVALPTSPWWVSDNASGFSTLYANTGKQVPLFVVVPPAPGSRAGTLGTPTGIVGNISTHSADFVVSEDGNSGQAIFIFATLDGTISGWNPAVDGVSSAGLSHTTIVVDRSPLGASYSGLAIATNKKGETFLYAADDSNNRRVDMFDGGFHLVKSFDDRKIPADFAPYGIQAIDGEIWVTYTALTNAPGGFVDVFDLDGHLIRRFGGRDAPFNSPWGLALAPANFGPMSNAILISNNVPVTGEVNAFDRHSGKFLGPLRDEKGKPIEIDQLWGIHFGLGGASNGATNQLFFTAGTNNYADGRFGVITFAH